MPVPIGDGVDVTMNAMPTNKGLGLIAAGGMLVGVTVLLTVLFSILGNLSCAVVAGLIFGSSRRWQWHVLLVSLVFPAVVLALSHYSKVELATAKVYQVAMLTGLAFWVVFGLTLSLHFLERREGTSPSDAPPAAGEAGSAVVPAAVRAPGLNVALLQGIWTCEETGPDGRTQCKTLRIEDGKFTLGVTRSARREQVVAHGTLRMDESLPGRVEFTSDAPP